MDHYVDPRIVEAIQAAARRERSQVTSQPFARLSQWLRELFTFQTQRCC
jgi:hypothetical protein